MFEESEGVVVLALLVYGPDYILIKLQNGHLAGFRNVYEYGMQLC
jgi:hypothetical protein